MRPTSPRPAPAYLTDSVPARRGHPLGFAHRGAAVDRENSLAAFVDAHAAGFTYLELDVRTTADGELVVFIIGMRIRRWWRWRSRPLSRTW